MPEVFPLTPSYVFTRDIQYTNFVVTLGDGYEQRVNRNLSWGPRGDGLGTTDGVSYKGVNKFKLTFNRLSHVNANDDALANKLWKFYQDRKGNGESFYFYDPTENAIDLTGEEVTGRYLVRFSESVLSREHFAQCLFSTGLELIEVRS